MYQISQTKSYKIVIDDGCNPKIEKYINRSKYIIARTSRKNNLSEEEKEKYIFFPGVHISRCHAHIVSIPPDFKTRLYPYYVIVDGCEVASLNGTWINGKKLNRVYELQDGDAITFGGTYPKISFYIINNEEAIEEKDLTLNGQYCEYV